MQRRNPAAHPLQSHLFNTSNIWSADVYFYPFGRCIPHTKRQHGKQTPASNVQRRKVRRTWNHFTNCCGNMVHTAHNTPVHFRFQCGKKKETVNAAFHISAGVCEKSSTQGSCSLCKQHCCFTQPPTECYYLHMLTN